MSRIKPSGSFNSFIRYTDINARSFYRYTLCFIRLRCQQKTKTYFDVATVSDNFCRSKFFPLYSRAIAAPLRTPFLSPHPNTSCGSSLAAVVKHWPARSFRRAPPPDPAFLQVISSQRLNRGPVGLLARLTFWHYYKIAIEERKTGKTTNWQKPAQETSYRPIPLLPVLSKLLERVILKRLR